MSQDVLSMFEVPPEAQLFLNKLQLNNEFFTRRLADALSSSGLSAPEEESIEMTLQGGCFRLSSRSPPSRSSPSSRTARVEREETGEREEAGEREEGESEKTTLLEARFRHLGNYGPLIPPPPEDRVVSGDRAVSENRAGSETDTQDKETATTIWYWDKEVRPLATAVPEELRRDEYVITPDPMLVSLILAYLTESLQLEHVYTFETSLQTYVALGLTQISFPKNKAPAELVTTPPAGV